MVQTFGVISTELCGKRIPNTLVLSSPMYNNSEHKEQFKVLFQGPKDFRPTCLFISVQISKMNPYLVGKHDKQLAWISETDKFPNSLSDWGPFKIKTLMKLQNYED